MGMVGMGMHLSGDGWGWDEVLRGRLGMELRLAGTVGDGDHCSSPCSSLILQTHVRLHSAMFTE
jgi:hypothetical protein